MLSPQPKDPFLQSLKDIKNYFSMFKPFYTLHDGIQIISAETHNRHSHLHLMFRVAVEISNGRWASSLAWLRIWLVSMRERTEHVQLSPVLPLSLEIS